MFVDPVPFSLLRKRLPVVIDIILCEKPGRLTVRELLKAGCTVDTLIVSGATKADLLCIFRPFYEHMTCFSYDRQDAIIGIFPLAQKTVPAAAAEAPVEKFVSFDSSGSIVHWKLMPTTTSNEGDSNEGDAGAVDEDDDIDCFDDSRIVQISRMISDYRITKRVIAVSPDRATFLTADAMQHIHLWSVNTGKKIHTIRDGNFSEIQGLCYYYYQRPSISTATGLSSIVVKTPPLRPAGVSTATTSADTNDDDASLLASLRSRSCKVVSTGTLEPHIFDLICTVSISISNLFTGELEHWLVGHTGTVNRLLVLDDGITIASASSDATIRLWFPVIVPTSTTAATTVTGSDTDDTTVVEVFKSVILTGHRAKVTSLVVLPNGYLASSGGDTTVRIWNIQLALKIGKERLSSSGGTELTAPYCCVKMIGGTTSRIRFDGTFGLFVLGDACTVGCCNANGSITLWDTAATGTQFSDSEFVDLEDVVTMITGAHVQATCAAVLSDGVTIVFGGCDGIELWQC